MSHPDTCVDPQPSYYCPTSGEFESPCHGGFDRCCQFPIMHLTVNEDDPLAIYRYAAQRERVGMAATREFCEALSLLERVEDLLGEPRLAGWQARREKFLSDLRDFYRRTT